MPGAARRATVAAIGVALGVGAGTAAAAPADTTAPVISRTVTGLGGDDGWYRGPVNVRWTVTDPESPWTTSGCDARTVSEETSGMTLECRASSAGGTSTDSVTLKIDSTAPSVTGAAPDRPPDAHGWFRAPVSVTFSGEDGLSGIASCGVVHYA